jgi:hypothetical protein
MAMFVTVGGRRPVEIRLRGQHFTKSLLVEAASKGPAWDYNRQLDPEKIGTLPDFNFPVKLAFFHRHRHGQPCEPHVRCVVLISRQHPSFVAAYPDRFERTYAIVDVPTDFFRALPRSCQRKRRK